MGARTLLRNASLLAAVAAITLLASCSTSAPPAVDNGAAVPVRMPQSNPAGNDPEGSPTDAGPTPAPPPPAPADPGAPPPPVDGGVNVDSDPCVIGATISCFGGTCDANGNCSGSCSLNQNSGVITCADSSGDQCALNMANNPEQLSCAGGGSCSLPNPTCQGSCSLNLNAGTINCNGNGSSCTLNADGSITCFGGTCTTAQVCSGNCTTSSTGAITCADGNGNTCTFSGSTLTCNAGAGSCNFPLPTCTGDCTVGDNGDIGCTH